LLPDFCSSSFFSLFLPVAAIFLVEKMQMDSAVAGAAALPVFFRVVEVWETSASAVLQYLL
jgi:hypothetical protein